MRYPSSYTVGLITAAVGVLLVSLAAAPMSADAAPTQADVTIPVVSGTDLPAGSGVVTQGTNGSGQATVRASSGRMAPESLPGGYCSSNYAAYDSHSAFTVSVQSIGACTGNIEQIIATAYVIANGKYVAENTFGGADTSESDTTATYHCGSLSKCNSLKFGGTDAQTFQNASGWSKAIGSCKISDTLMTCGGTLKTFTF